MSSPTPTTERLHIKDVPSSLHDEVATRLALHSVGFSAIQLRNGREHASPAGSGTLVRLLGRRAILTAHHVVVALAKADRVGLLVDWAGALRRCVYERSHLHLVPLARGTIDSEGPDLGVIFLPEGDEASTSLVAHKSFYDLDRRIAQRASAYPGVEYGFWFPCGVPAEGAQRLGPIGPFAEVTGYWGLCALASRPTELDIGEYDYLDLRIDADADGVPTDLGGMSGGGLWQVLIHKSLDGTLSVQDYVLSGVAFYEWPAPERRLRCHGRRSVYEHVPALATTALATGR